MPSTKPRLSTAIARLRSPRWLVAGKARLLPLLDLGALAIRNARLTEQAQLAEAERARLAAIVTSSDDAIFANTLGGIITDWNSGAERLYGYRRAEIVGRSGRVPCPA